MQIRKVCMPRESEVEQDDVPAPMQKHIGRLEVVMAASLPM
jgi:hypothetical protein